MALKHFRGQHPVEYVDDCKRICAVLRDAGYDVTLHDAEDMWMKISEYEYCAVWLVPPKSDAELLARLLRDA